MDRTADLEAGLRFVSGRIVEQAALSGDPLNDEQRLLLNYMPSSPVASFDPETTLVPRNINYERLCALGKAAYLSDRQVNPTSLDWEFAFAVFTLNRHPMWGLLKWAGLKYRRPWWDQLLLIVAALLFVLLLMLAAWNVPWTALQLIGIGFGCVALLLSMHFVSRRIEERELEKEIERYRLASHFRSMGAG